MKKLVILFLMVASTGILKAEMNDLATYKSLFTLNFIRHIGWPEETKQGDFVIGVLKSSTIANELKIKTKGKKFGYQNIVIKEFKNIEEISDCQILYVASYINYNKYSSVISNKLNNSNSLIITEDNDAINSGSMINFTIVEDKLKFEVSQSNANKYGLKFSGSLISMKNAIQK